VYANLFCYNTTTPTKEKTMIKTATLLFAGAFIAATTWAEPATCPVSAAKAKGECAVDGKCDKTKAECAEKGKCDLTAAKAKGECSVAKCDSKAEKVNVATAASVPADAKSATAQFKVSGMTCGACEGKVKKALTGLDGVTSVDKVCNKSSAAAVTYDPAKVKPEQIQAAIKATGFKVEGAQKEFPVSGMTCGACEGKVKKALGKLEGVTSVDKVCHKSSVAAVTYDASKVSEQQISDAISATGFSVKN